MKFVSKDILFNSIIKHIYRVCPKCTAEQKRVESERIFLSRKPKECALELPFIGGISSVIKIKDDVLGAEDIFSNQRENWKYIMARKKRGTAQLITFNDGYSLNPDPWEYGERGILLKIQRESSGY